MDKLVLEDINDKLTISGEYLEKTLFFYYLAPSDDQTRGIQFKNYTDCCRMFANITRLKFQQESESRALLIEKTNESRDERISNHVTSESNRSTQECTNKQHNNKQTNKNQTQFNQSR